MPRIQSKPFKPGAHPKPSKRVRKSAEGAGITDFLRNPVKRLKDAFSGPRHDSFAPKVRETLKQFGDCPIESLVVQRAPINGMIDSAFDKLTTGRWSERKAANGYDKFMHLSAIAEVRTPNGQLKRVVLEKLEFVNISTSFKQENDAEIIHVPMSGRHTLNSMLNAARQRMGEQLFFGYDAFSNNCQVFVRTLLKESGLLNPDLEHWIMQPVDKLLSELPWYTKGVARALTEACHRAHIALEGRGLPGATLEAQLLHRTLYHLSSNRKH